MFYKRKLNIEMAECKRPFEQTASLVRASHNWDR